MLHTFSAVRSPIPGIFLASSYEVIGFLHFLIADITLR